MSTSREQNEPVSRADVYFESIIQTHDAASKARNKRVQRIKQAKPRPKNTPLWSPDGVDLDVVPPEVKQAIEELVQPIYEQYVVNAADSLEKSLGASIAHLLWLEILDQFDIKREYTKYDAVLNASLNRPEMIERHLRLIGSKLQLGYFLIRLKELRKSFAEQDNRHLSISTTATAPTEIDLLIDQLPKSENPSAPST
jgi:hypothetical protein